MKAKKFVKKVARYIELSKEFEQKESDLFDVNQTQELIHNDCTTTCSRSNIPPLANWHGSRSRFPKTRAEVIRENAEAEAERADRYDEYKKLRSQLSKYTQAYFEL